MKLSTTVWLDKWKKNNSGESDSVQRTGRPEPASVLLEVLAKMHVSRKKLFPKGVGRRREMTIFCRSTWKKNRRSFATSTRGARCRWSVPRVQWREIIIILRRPECGGRGREYEKQGTRGDTRNLSTTDSIFRESFYTSAAAKNVARNKSTYKTTGRFILTVMKTARAAIRFYCLEGGRGKRFG